MKPGETIAMLKKGRFVYLLHNRISGYINENKYKVSKNKKIIFESDSLISASNYFRELCEFVKK